MPTPTIQSIGKILGLEAKAPGSKPNLIDQTKNTVAKNTQNTVDTIKTSIYNEAKTTLDNVFSQNSPDNKQASNDQVASVTVLGINSAENVTPSYIIDLSSNSNQALSLSVNKAYFLKFQNIPANYCIYINNDKYPLSDNMIKIQFSKGGSFPIKANSCNLDDKNIGTLMVN